jgi:hypothetical protein
MAMRLDLAERLKSLAEYLNPDELAELEDEIKETGDLATATFSELQWREAHTHLNSGLSVLPLKANKRPAIDSWKSLQTCSVDERELSKWFGSRSTKGLGIICGTVSCNLTVIDVESLEAWNQLEASIQSVPALAELMPSTSLSITPSGGRHLFIHADEAPRGNEVLARDAEGELLIETRGEGGYAMVPLGKGRSWVRYFVREDRALWTGAQLEMVRGLARQFCKKPTTTPTTTTPAPKAAAPRAPGLSPIDDYNQRADFHQLLTAQGARLIRTDADGRAHYARPGKAENGAAGNLFPVDGVLKLFVHSTNWPSLQAQRSYTAYGFRLAVDHGDNQAMVQELVRKLGQEGWGDPPVTGTLKIKGQPAGSPPAPTPEDWAPVLRCASDARPKPIHWLWDGRIPLGMISVLEGAVDKGKTTMAIDLMARLSRGWAMPGLQGYNTPAASIVIGLEDHFENVFVPRLMAAGADLTKINQLTGFRFHEAGKASKDRRLVLTLDDIERLGETITKTGTKFVFFDSVMGLLPGKIDANSDQGTRAVLEPLAQMAEIVGASILIGRHWAKGAGTRVASERGIGSVAWGGVARSVLQVAQHPDDEKIRVLAVAKGNLAPKSEHLEFTIASKEITLPDGEIVKTASIVWGGTCSLHIDDLGGKKLTSERQTIAKTCEDWMVGYFDEEHRSVSSNQLAEDAKEAGYSFAAMRRARNKMQGEGRLTVRKTGTAWMVNWLEEGVQAKID